MAVKVLITRRLKEGKAMKVFSLLNKHRAEAINQLGYITGETLIGYDDNQKLVVVSTWQNVDNWLKWKEDPTRQANEAEIEEYLEGPTQYEIFSFGAFPPMK